MYFHAFNNNLLKRKSSLFPVTLVLLHLLMIVFAFSQGTIFTKDSAEYLQQATNLKEYASWYCGSFNAPIQPELYSQRPLLYGLFLMIIQLFCQKAILIIIVQSLISLANIYIAFLILKKYTKGNYQPLFLLAALFFFPTQLIYSGMIMSEILLQFLVMLSVYSILHFIEKRSLKYLLLFQLAISCAILTKPVFIVFPVFSLVFLLAVPELKSYRTKILYSHLLPIFIIFAISFNNYRHTGYFEYSSIIRKYSINYSALYSTAFEEGNTIALQQIDSIQTDALKQPTYAGKAKVIQSGAGRLIGLHLDSYIYLTAKGVLLFFIDHSRYDLEAFTGRTNSAEHGLKQHYTQNGWKGVINYLNSFSTYYILYLITSMLFNAVVVLGMIRFAMLKEQPLYLRLLLTGIILYIALLTGMTGTTRFRMPVFLILLVVNSIALKYYSFPFFKKRPVQWSE